MDRFVSYCLSLAACVFITVYTRMDNCTECGGGNSAQEGFDDWMLADAALWDLDNALSVLNIVIVVIIVILNYKSPNVNKFTRWAYWYVFSLLC
jgi:hypothetical protein